MRYLPLTGLDRQAMLAKIGAGSIDDLFVDVPVAARQSDLLPLPNHQGELEVERAFAAMAGKNLAPSTSPCFLGAGAYRHHIPASVDHLIQRSEFLTSYTPYQPEISQGTLQALFEFQTQVALITGMEVANASMYDGATGCAEAVLMAHRLTKRRRSILSGDLHPQYRQAVETMIKFGDFETDPLPADDGSSKELSAKIDKDTACVVVQNPGFFGHIEDFSPLADACHAEGALLIVVVTEVLSLGAIKPPGEMGADIVVAEGQSIGVPLSFGGPHVGLFATRKKYIRQMPGRLCGKAIDADGQPGYVLTMSAREQHIRREKATSNICTNSGLCALAFCIHLALLGDAGFRGLARLNHAKAVAAAERMSSIDGADLVTERFFNEFTLRLAKPAAQAVEDMAARGILAGVPASRLMPDVAEAEPLLLVAVTETVSDEDVDLYCRNLAEVLA